MTDTIVLILIAAVAIALGTSLLAFRAAQEALRVARAGGDTPFGVAGGATKADREAGKRLAQRAGALLAKVNAFPPALLGPGADGKVRDAVLWTASEVASLRDVTPALLQGSAQALEAIGPEMAWLLQQAEVIRATQRGSGQYLIDFPHDTWRRNYQGALAGLQELVARGEATAK